MPLVETESIILKTYNLAEADRIVVLLTREHGVVRGVAKGAKRLKSRFGSGLEPFSFVRATYFQKDAVELVSIQGSDLIESNFAAASNPDFLQKFSYLGDLLLAISPPHDPNEKLFRMTKACIETASGDAATLLSIGVYFELWTLRLAGYMPDWGHCDDCGRTFDSEEDAQVRANFHLICDTCKRSAGGRSLNAIERSIASNARRLSPTDFAAASSDRSEHLRTLSNLLKQMLSQAIGREILAEKDISAEVRTITEARPIAEARTK